MHHNDDSSTEEQDDDVNRAESNNSPPPEKIRKEFMETFDQRGYEEALKILMKHAEKPCITSITGHAAHGRVLAAPVNIGVKEYLLKRVTQLPNGSTLDPTKITMTSYNDFLNQFTLVAGSQVTSTDIGMLLATGCGEHVLPVYRQINPVILSYGDKIHNIWEPEKAEDGNSIYDYLRPQLISFLKEMNYVPIDGGILRTQYHSVVEGLIHGFLYSNVAVVTCYDYKTNLPLLLETLVKEFNFKVLFHSVENLDVVFAHTTMAEGPRYMFILSDEAKIAVLSIILLIIPLLNNMSGCITNKIARVITTSNIKLQPTASFLFGELKVVKEETQDHCELRLKRVESQEGCLESSFFDRLPIPRGSNIILQLPAATDYPDDCLPIDPDLLYVPVVFEANF